MTRFRVEVEDRHAHVIGDFATEEEAERLARSYAVADRLVATVIRPDNEAASTWEPLSLDGLTDLQTSIYEYVRTNHKRTPPVDVKELVSELRSSPEAVAEALSAPLTERLLDLRPAGPNRESWIVLDGASIDAAWRRPRLG